MNRDIIQIMLEFYPELTKTDLLVIFTISKSEEYISTLQIAKILNKDRTTIQKSIMKLVESKWITKYQINLERGFKFVYDSRVDVFELIEERLTLRYHERMEYIKKLKNGK